MLASIPALRPEDHWALVDWITFRAAFKVGNHRKAAEAKESFLEHLREMRSEADKRQISDYEYVDEAEPGWEY